MKHGILIGLLMMAILMLAGAAHAAPYDFGPNGWIEVDYWADSGAAVTPYETILVIDWNQTNGPYVSEAHAWGFRWGEADGPLYVSDALAAVDAAGALDVTTAYGGGFLSDATYADADGDAHSTTGYSGWWWVGETSDGGATWTGNAGGIDQEPLVDGSIEGFNMDGGAWWSDTLTVPTPEPASLGLLALGAAAAMRRRTAAGRER